jgi:hypothetical protein
MIRDAYSAALHREREGERDHVLLHYQENAGLFGLSRMIEFQPEPPNIHESVCPR